MATGTGIFAGYEVLDIDPVNSSLVLTDECDSAPVRHPSGTADYPRCLLANVAHNLEGHWRAVGDPHDSNCIAGGVQAGYVKSVFAIGRDLRIRVRAVGKTAATRSVWTNSPNAKLRWIGGDVHNPVTVFRHRPVLCIYAVVCDLADSRTIGL